MTFFVPTSARQGGDLGGLEGDDEKPVARQAAGSKHDWPATEHGIAAATRA